MVAALILIGMAAIDAQAAARRVARGGWVSPAVTHGISLKLGGAIALFLAAWIRP